MRPVSIGTFDIVAIATSAGGLQALSELPADFPVPILVVQHLQPKQPSHLVHILQRRTRLQVKQAEAGDLLQPGTIYIAPPDRHLLVSEDHRVVLSDDPLVHFVRPAADRLFASVAEHFHEHAIAVVLTGCGSDGEEGVYAVKVHGGIVIAQDEGTSEHFGMPRAAIRSGLVDFVLPLTEIPGRLLALVSQDKG
jgi:two-component system chemotaxis response regulator CheB